MNITLTSLEALILKATHESLPCPDAAALEAFCAVMRDSPEGPQWAAQALAARIHTSNAKEALLALSMLDRCMRRCDSNFHAEVGKFRFLNELIKLVSPKYFADRTAPEVRTRVLQLLHAWSIEYPKESKFKVAFDMLKNQGVVKETPPPLPPEDVPPTTGRSKSAIFEDEEKSKLLQKLLQSKKAEDLQHANRLIKTMVRDEERRNEAHSRRAQEVSAALDSAGLLKDMLVRAADASQEELQLIRELHTSCASLKPALQRLATCPVQADYIGDILHAIDVLDEVFTQYNAFISTEKNKPHSQRIAQQAEAPNDASLLDFAGANIGKDGVAISQSKPVKSVVIDELGDIFASESTSSIAEPLKPVNLMPSEDSSQKPDKGEGWNDLDSLGDQLMKQSLPDNAKRIENFNSKPTKKIPMNALASPKHEPPPINNGVLFDLDFFTKKPEDNTKKPPDISNQSDILSQSDIPTQSDFLSQSNISTQSDIPSQSDVPSNFDVNDDLIVDISTDIPNKNGDVSPIDNILDLNIELDNTKIDNATALENMKQREAKKCSEIKSMGDIKVSLDSVQPSKVSPMTVFEEEGGVTVVLHFCQDKPRSDVNVIVVSTTSKSRIPIEDYKFQSVVPKGCKVRLLTASGTSLPAYNPFLPPPAITQVMLIARPPSFPVSLKFVITYMSDEDMVSEMGEVDRLPLDSVS